MYGSNPHLICSLCDHNPEFKSFQMFLTHLYGTTHQQKLLELVPLSNKLQRLSAALDEPTEINYEAVTFVFWDIKMCPVPRGCSPRRLGPCIKRFLENQGYSGPLTITAIGVLTDVDSDILEGVYSSGIDFNNTPECFEFISTLHYLLSGLKDKNPPPANIMVITSDEFFSSKYAVTLQSSGYNLQPSPFGSPFFLEGSGALEDDKCSYETSESALWICTVCDYLSGRGFENFTTHVNSRRHNRKLLDYLPANDRFTREYPLNHGD
ncbi:hypothetical protein CARUB_v10027773mg [Capsella rubella]|uniref:NYN domain-containing protein n=1 Tax=Capsella rubella TaxID=81985 RepID=R0EZZ9_9BRAS|nr:hypothetical protein CARUB_v10027773mg [Capsella rubella]